MPPDDLLSASATRLAGLIRDRHVSSIEVVQAHLDRIAAVNPQLNAVVQLAPDALARAAVADQAISRGEPVGPLHGVPFTAKDWLETEGLICAAGFEERATYVPSRDATVVARMRRAGAILLGKTNVVTGAPVYDRPNNPHDPARTPGSSSSGEAAIIAAGGSPFGLGSDSGGSIRWPAHCSGIVGLKPSTGLVPNTGHFPRIGHMSDPRTAIGPLTRSAHDLAPLPQVLAGADPRDPGAFPVGIGNPEDVDLSTLRVAVFTDLPGARPTPETIDAVATAARALAAAGCSIEEAAPPRLDESLPITRAYWARVQSVSFREWIPNQQGTLDAARIEEARFEWERFTRSLYTFMERYDAILCPAAQRPAPVHDDWTLHEYLYTLPFSLTRQPAAVVPWATSPEGLPIGVQIAGRTWRDDVVIALAVALEDARSPLAVPQVPR
ncbi:MAG: amidase [Chloroflexi bacterium]|nr:amidase [Chloroflexota bacterium]MDA1145606.1 amidase [Chloroflexota bacterium]